MTLYVTDYAEKEARREAYIQWLSRVCARFDDIDLPRPTFAPVDKRTEAVMQQP